MGPASRAAALLLVYSWCSASSASPADPQQLEMAAGAPLMMRVLASSITAANRAGKIIRDVMSQGELGIVEKVPYFID